MKKIIFIIFVMLLFNNNAQIIFPKGFPNELKNKKKDTENIYAVLNLFFFKPLTPRRG